MRSLANVTSRMEFAVATPIDIIAPIKRGHIERRLRQEQRPNDARERSGQRGDDDERILPALEVDDHQQIHQHRRKHQSDAEPSKRFLHALHLAADDDLAARRQSLSNFSVDLLNLAGNRTQVAVLHVGIDVEHRLHVAVIRVHGLNRVTDGGQVAE